MAGTCCGFGGAGRAGASETSFEPIDVARRLCGSGRSARHEQLHEPQRFRKRTTEKFVSAMLTSWMTGTSSGGTAPGHRSTSEACNDFCAASTRRGGWSGATRWSGSRGWRGVTKTSTSRCSVATPASYCAFWRRTSTSGRTRPGHSRLCTEGGSTCHRMRVDLGPAQCAVAVGSRLRHRRRARRELGVATRSDRDDDACRLDVDGRRRGAVRPA